MCRLTPIAGNKVNQPLQGILERYHLDLAGAPNFLRILARSPAAMGAYTAAEQALADGQLTPGQREQIALAVAEINNCNYCLVAHTLTSRDAGLSDEDIRLARTATAHDPKTAAMLRFTQAVVLQRGDVRDVELETVRGAGVSDFEVIEIIANIALNIFTNYLNIVSNTEVDFPMLHPEFKNPRAAENTCGLSYENNSHRP